MENPFFQHWFQGLEQALNAMDDSVADTLMACCGRGCSESYSKQIFIEEYRAAETLDAFLSRLNARFGELAARRVGEDTVEFVYTRCGCDLVLGGFMSSPKLCLCSLKSLQYNWEAILGEGSVDCRLVQSILGGGDCCRLIVKIKQG